MADASKLATFSVDTHLFRELGELLVGRDATALLELVKNAYDADATGITVFAESLQDTEKGYIRIVDDGHGMDLEEFLNGFLRIASRAKEKGDRRSPLLKRRFTGAKGVGRLAAHKLARYLEVQSIPTADGSRRSRRKIVASIDWDLIESVPTLDAMPAGAILVSDLPVASGAPPGTTILLRRLRRPWTASDAARFAGEVAGFEPLSFLIEPVPRGLLKGSRVLHQPRVRDVADGRRENSFRISLDGDFRDLGDRSEQTALEYVEWIIELHVDGPKGTKRLSIFPTRNASDMAEGLQRDVALREHERKLTYDVRIMVRPNQVPRALSAWSQRAAGIRVFMEGFRVLPYGEPGDDWLGLDRDVSERVRRPQDASTIELAKNLLGQAGKDAGLGLLPNKHYYGGVFLTVSGSPSLQMLVNREGFIPGPAYSDIRDTVRSAIWLAQYQIHSSKEEKRKESRATRRTFEGEIRRFGSMIQEIRSLAHPGKIAALRARLSEVEQEAGALREMASEIIHEAALLRDTASVGLQMARFVHELNGLLGIVVGIESSVGAIRELPSLPRGVKGDLRRLAALVQGLRKALERNSVYFGGLLSNTARRRRSTQPLLERFEEAAANLSEAIRDRGQRLESVVPSDLRTMPMYASEVRTIFLNLLTNSVKAAGQGGRIRVSAKRLKGVGRAEITIENSGVAVDLSSADRWFEPFRTTTEDPDPVLGQGLGLGLPIVRMIVRDYGGAVGFRAPSRGYKTAVFLTLPLKS